MINKCYLLLLSAAIINCSNPPEGNIYYGTLGFGETKIIVLNADGTAPVNYTAALYDINGNFIKLLQDFSAIGDVPRGIAYFDPFKFIVALSGNQDRLVTLDIYGQMTYWASDNNFSGTQIYQMARDRLNNYLVIEDTTIERFSVNGERSTSGATPYIAATFTGCTTALTAPRGIAVDSSGNIAVSFGTAVPRINVYATTSAGSVSTCAQYNPTGTSPIALVGHSNGLFYVGTQGDDVIRSMTSTGTFASVWAVNTSVISDPVAMMEMPNGDLLVASDATDTIERITTSGTRVGSQPFIKNAFTGGVTQMLLLRGQ